MEAHKAAASKVALLLAAIIWGSSFLVVKGTVGTVSSTFLVGMRGTIAFVLLAVIFHRKLRALDKGTLLGGALMGAFVFLSYTLQTVGLSLGTMPGKCAFLTSNYCVLVPFLSWALTRKRPTGRAFLAAFVTVCGVGLISLDGGLGITAGDALIMLAGLCTACNMCANARFAKKHDAISLTIVQFGVIAILGWGGVLATGSIPASLNLKELVGLLYLGVFPTGLCMMLQSIGIKHTDPSSAAILISSESIFSVLLSVLLFHERVTLTMAAGFVLIFGAILLSEVRSSAFRRNRLLPRWRKLYRHA